MNNKNPFEMPVVMQARTYTHGLGGNKPVAVDAGNVTQAPNTIHFYRLYLHPTPHFIIVNVCHALSDVGFCVYVFFYVLVGVCVCVV